jgi:hypothetical protein
MIGMLRLVVSEDTLMDVVYHYLDGVVEGMTYDEVTIKKL